MPGEGSAFGAAPQSAHAPDTMSSSPLAETDLGPDAEPEVGSDIDVRELEAEPYTEGDFPPATTEGEVLVQAEPREEAAASEPSTPPAPWEPPPTPTEE